MRGGAASFCRSGRIAFCNEMCFGNDGMILSVWYNDRLIQTEGDSTNFQLLQWPEYFLTLKWREMEEGKSFTSHRYIIMYTRSELEKCSVSFLKNYFILD